MPASSSSPSKILVTGATGYVGGRLVPCLLREGYHVRCLVRDADRVRGHPWSDDVDVVVGDALDPDTLPRAMREIDAVYYLIHSLGAGENTFAERDRIAAANTRNAAAAAGVSRIIYLGGMRPKGERHSKHLTSRIETGDVLRDGPIPVTEFRAAQIVGSGSLSFELVRYLTERVPVMICPRWVQTPTQPIAVRNALEYLIAALTRPESAGEIIEIGGADVLTYEEMFRTYAAVRGLKRWIVNVPFLTPRLSSHWIGLVTPLSNTIARPLVEGLDNEVVVDDGDKARTLFPDVEPIAFEAAVRLALRRIETDELPSVWHSAVSSSPAPSEQTTILDTTEGLYREVRRTTVSAPPDVAFDTITRLGGENGWLYGSALWHVRGWIDQVLGGVGFRKGRRDPEQLRVGDAVDFWRVEALEPDRLLRLRAEMQLPGRGWLQFEVTPTGEEHRTQVTQTAFFEPKGLGGFLYWNLVWPVHHLIFNGLLREIGSWIEERSSAAANERSPTGSSENAAPPGQESLSADPDVGSDAQG